jgi:hypothetical protein
MEFEKDKEIVRDLREARPYSVAVEDGSFVVGACSSTITTGSWLPGREGIAAGALMMASANNQQ